MNTKVIICCHKESLLPQSDFYLPIQVGKANSDVELGIQGDNTGENISYKNASYCELTGMYWAWKNLKDVDVIGLCHYRRFFDFHNQCHRVFPTTEFPISDFNKKDYSIPNIIVDKVSHGCVVVPKHLTTLPLYLQYNNIHNSDDLRILEKVVKMESDEKYYRAFLDIIYRNNKMYPFNMFIMNRPLFDEYCSWLFSILDRVEEQIDISHYSDYQKRNYGFMAERLFNVLLKRNKLPIIEFPILSFSESKLYNSANSFPRYLLRILALDSINLITRLRM